MPKLLLPTALTLALSVALAWSVTAAEVALTNEDDAIEQVPLTPESSTLEGKRDDWTLDINALNSRGKPGRRLNTAPALASPVAPTLSPGGAPNIGAMARSNIAKKSLGFAAGGAKDVNNFRKNVHNDYLPLPADITTEGLYYDYYFDTGTPLTECRELFCPTYNLAMTPDPISGKPEYYMAVGLHSNLEADTFKRKKLNLVVVLDISGSMKSPFNRYHYDQKHQEKSEQSDTRRKISIATEAVQNLTRQLRNDDRLAMVVFNNQAHLAKPLNPVGKTNMEKIREHIGKLPALGGTNFSAGYEKGAQLLIDRLAEEGEQYENRIIFLTDAMPNRGELSENGLFGMTERNARRQIHTTFIGIGVDFNSELIESISKVRGANYYSVHSGERFNQLLDKEFDYMVTPMVFDLSVRLVTDSVSIEKVYGSPQADLSTGQVMRVSTLFPSPSAEEAIKGGLVLLKLSDKPASGQMTLSASYETRDARRHGNEQRVDWQPKSTSGPWYTSSGIRKGIVLARYANLLTHWILEERSRAPKPLTDSAAANPGFRPCTLASMQTRGICLPPPKLGRHERRSRPLTVNPHSARTLGTFAAYLKAEKGSLGDKNLDREIKLLSKLVSVANANEQQQGKRDDWRFR